MKNKKCLLPLFSLLFLSGCILAGAGGSTSDGGKETVTKKKAQEKLENVIYYDANYSGYISVVKIASWKEWLSQTMFFEHMGAYTDQEREKLNRDFFDGDLKIIEPDDSIYIQAMFKEDKSSANTIIGLFKKGTINGNIIEFTKDLFPQDQNIKNSNLDTSKEASVQSTTDWHLFVSPDGSIVDGFRNGTIESPINSNFVIRFHLELNPA